MESKKINQLATEMAPASTDLTIIGDPITGVSKKVTLEQISSLFSGLISFYANYAAFPATGEIDTIYCAKDTNKLYLWSGSAYVEVFPSQALLNTYQLRSEKGASNGYASLDSLGKVPIAQLPSSLMEYKGTWDASTNTPTLANGAGDTGDVYICSVAGTVNFGAGAITFAVGDYVIYSGTIWQRSSGATGTVTSVGITETGDALSITGSPITTSGTINIGFAGSAAQYVAGDGSLVTFPTLLSSDSLVKLVRNQSGATMTAGTVVYISGATGNKPLISKALATGDATSAQTYGLLQTDIANNADGYVVVIGNVTSLDTSALTEGQQLYLSGTTAGTYTTTKPYAPIHLVYVGIVLRAHPTMGIIGVKIQNGYEMDELHNVDAYLPNNNDILSYNTTTSLWEHKQIATTLGYTPIALTSLSATTPLSYNNTTGAFTISQATTSANGYLSSTDWNTFNSKGSGSVTSVAALTLGTTGTDLSSTVANGTTTPVITLNVPTASATNRGALSSADWTTFNNKQPAIGYTPADDSLVVKLAGAQTITGGKTFTVQQFFQSYPIYSQVGIALDYRIGASAVSYCTTVGADVNGLQINLDGGGYNHLAFASTSASNTYTLPNATGTIALTSNIPTLSGTAPISYSSGVISIAQATTSTSGYLSSTDWNTFNGKQNTITNPVIGTGTSGQVTYFNGTSSVTSSSSFKFDGTNLTIGNPSSALAQLHVYNASAAATILLQTNSTTDYSEIAVRNNSSTATSYFRQYSTAATGSDFGISRAGLALFFSNYATNFAIGTRNGGDLILGTADTERARILASNGYVGINTSTPGRQLEIYNANDAYMKFNGVRAGNHAFTVGNDSAGFIVYDETSAAYRLIISNSTGAATFSSSVGVGGAPTGTYGALSIFGSGISLKDDYSGKIEIGRYSAAFPNAYIKLGANANSLKITNNTDSADLVTILNTGNIGIGTSSPSTKLHVAGTAANTVSYVSDTTGYALYQLGNTGGGLYLGIDSSTASGFANGAYSRHIYSTGAYPLIISTNDTERMRITSGGNVGIGTTSPNKTLTVSASVAGSVTEIYNTRNNGSGDFVFVTSLGSNNNNTSNYHYIASTGGADKMYVYGNGNIVNINNSYGTLSDISLKENIVNATPKLADILKLKVRNFNLIDDETKQIGFIAQEFEEVFPSMVDIDGKTGMKTIKTSVLTPMHTKAIQELYSLIQEQQKQIEELKLKIK